MNTGANDSRIVGIKRSQGKYILFLDSDDFLPICSLNLLYNCIISNNVDIVIGSIIHENGNKIIIVNNAIGNGIYNRITYLKALLVEDCSSGLHAKLYKRELFTEEVFCLPKGIDHHEDFFMNIMLALNVSNVGIFNELEAYKYSYQNPNSVSRSSFMTENECNVLSYLLKQKLDKHGLWNLCQKEYTSHFYTTIYHQFTLRNMEYKSYLSLKKSLNLKPNSQEIRIELLNEYHFFRFVWSTCVLLKNRILIQLVIVIHFFERLFSK